jgi:hypothetical protein
MTVWPLLYMGAFMYLFARAWFADDETIFSPAVIVLHVLALLTNVGLLVVYIRDLLRRELPSESQAIWGVLMGLLGPLAMLPYWWRFIRPADASSPSRPGAGSAPG